VEGLPSAGRLTARVALAAASIAAFAAGAASGAPTQEPPPPVPAASAPEPAGSSVQPAAGPVEPRFPARPSRAIGQPTHGRLVRGVQLPAEGTDHVTWDNVLKRVPNRGWRRWGTDRLVRLVLDVLHAYRVANPGAPRVLVGDLSRPHGGDFSARFGGLGHVSHQNGLDVDVYYPRRDRLALAPIRVSQIDRGLAADLVRRFVQAGAIRVFVGPHTGLSGPRRIVRPLRRHDNHLHVRIRP
jgi:murein endopeptidase